MRLAFHIGHLRDLAGHDHWVAGAAIGVIGLAGLLGWLTKGEREERPEEDGASGEAERPADEASA